jgi:hypothetical protein
VQQPCGSVVPREDMKRHSKAEGRSPNKLRRVITIFAYRSATKASTSARLPLEAAFLGTNTLTSTVWFAELVYALVNTIVRGWATGAHRSTVLTFTPSTHTSALPLLGSVDATHATCLPANEKRALVPEAVAYLR